MKEELIINIAETKEAYNTTPNKDSASTSTVHSLNKLQFEEAVQQLLEQHALQPTNGIYY